MWNRNLLWILLALAAVSSAFAGCGASSDSNTEGSAGSDMNDLATLLDPPKPAAPPATSAETPTTDQPLVEQAPPVEDARAEMPPAESPEAEQPSQTPTEAGETAETFGPESGRRGQIFHGDGQGYLYAVFSARFVAENKMIMAQIKKTMDLFEATNSRKPESHEEFWQAIIVDGGVKLPDLESDEEYFYDAEKAELMVRKPEPQG
jgi:hypothetical protein